MNIYRYCHCYYYYDYYYLHMSMYVCVCKHVCHAVCGRSKNNSQEPGFFPFRCFWGSDHQAHKAIALVLMNHPACLGYLDINVLQWDGILSSEKKIWRYTITWDSFAIMANVNLHFKDASWELIWLTHCQILLNYF